jgi:signal transduction histidine kinase/DNA-binding response OmpR family regulator
MIISLLIAVGTLTVQITSQYLILTSSISAFITTLAYFMLENPDLHYIEELNIATRQAESANNAKSDFLSSMSHEIRTPLNAIVGFSQALAKEDISGSAKDEVKEILNASTTLLETVNGILDISKIEANKVEILNVDYSTKKLINEIISQTNSRIGSKPLEFKIDIDKDIPPVLYGDVVRIKQIILNLLTNAIKYTKAGYINFRIDAQSSHNKCLLTIMVEDTGTGMTKEEIDLLFVKFQRFEMDKNTNILGTGLGMAITKGLVELMNGEIVVDSEHGKGSTFTIVIEQDISSKSIEEIATVEELQKIEPFNATGQRVLVVDDNKINLKVAERMLSEYKVTIDMVDSGRECINKIISGEEYDLIMLDIMMPKMKGPEVLQNLKAQPGFNTPVIALTADVVSGMDEKYTTQGFDDCLPKPIVEEELFYLLKRYLKEVTDEGLLEENYSEIETPVEVISPIVKEVLNPTPVEEPTPEEIELPAPAVEEIELPSLIEELPKLSEQSQTNVTEETIEEVKETNVELPKQTIEEEVKQIVEEVPKINITNDRFELIEQLKNNKENPSEYAKLANQIKTIAEKCELKELATIAYEHELAGKAEYQDFITKNYDHFINEIINNINIIKENINKE